MLQLIDFCDPYGAHPPLRCAFNAPVHTLVAHTPDQVKPLLDAVHAYSQQGLWCVGFVRYESAPAFDAAFKVHDADAALAWFGVYAHALPWPDDGTPASEPPPGAGLAAGIGLPDAAPDSATIRWHSPLSQADFDAHMGCIHQAIAAGEMYQMNYTAPLQGQYQGAALPLFKRLQRAQPNGYAACIDTGAEQVLSVSPELFFDWQPPPCQPNASAQANPLAAPPCAASTEHLGTLLTRPMKGTAPRGSHPAQDAALAQVLRASAKERAENVMIVDLLRNDVSRIAEPFSVKVPELFTVQTLPTVFQMVSDVTARTRAGTRLTDVFGALFPCGSITGAPKVQAMRAIVLHEPLPRGVYCGAIGVVRPGGHATFNVAIRTVTLRAGQARCGIGSGITADATAAAEWQEWQHKRVFLERASAPFELLETLRLENGVYINLIAHTARLQRAARHFGYKFDAANLHTALAAAAASCGQQALTKSATHNQPTVWRVRLRLAADGLVRVEKYILNQPLAHVLIALAAIPFEAATSEFTRFKTTRRAHYEAFAPTDPAVFDTLLYNPQGELTECTRGNIALKLDSVWVTPPLHCGLLDGVGREMALKQGRLTEQVVHLSDLPRVQAVAFVNSLRGWMAARLICPPDNVAES